MITKAIDSSKIDVVGEYEELKSEVSTLKAEIIQLEEKKKKTKKENRKT